MLVTIKVWSQLNNQTCAELKVHMYQSPHPGSKAIALAQIQNLNWLFVPAAQQSLCWSCLLLEGQLTGCWNSAGASLSAGGGG